MHDCVVLRWCHNDGDYSIAWLIANSASSRREVFAAVCNQPGCFTGSVAMPTPEKRNELRTGTDGRTTHGIDIESQALRHASQVRGATALRLSGEFEGGIEVLELSVRAHGLPLWRTDQATVVERGVGLLHRSAMAARIAARITRTGGSTPVHSRNASAA